MPKCEGLQSNAERIRLELIDDLTLQNGSMPSGEGEKMANALYWLLADNTDHYITNSSDITGAMICLERLGFDTLGVEGSGLDLEPPERACRVIYSPSALSGSDNARYRNLVARILTRPPSTVVSLIKPFESFAKFPIDGTTANRCLQAWKAGAVSANFLEIKVEILDRRRVNNAHDLRYRFVNHGTEPARTDDGIFQLAFAHALFVNIEICQQLQNVLKEPEDVLDWVHGQTTEHMSSSPVVSYHAKLEKRKLDAFNVFQAFFMGYYYAAFLTLVDTSTLELPTVDGRWGYCSAEFLKEMRVYCRNSAQNGLSRQEVIQILSQLLFSHKINVPNPARDQWCLGVVDKRTLLAQSLLGICKTPSDIGRFVLLDVDVGGIPTVNGLVMPGFAPSFIQFMPGETGVREIQERGPDVDFTSHIEADWDGNPENILLCFRYKGRRVGTVNPCVADLMFCHAYVNPVERCTEGPQRTILPAIECNLSDFQKGRIVFGGGGEAVVLVQVYGHPLMRYAAMAFYGVHHSGDMVITSNCLHEAIRRLRDLTKTNGIVIAGEGPRKETRPMRFQFKRRFAGQEHGYGS